MYVGRILPNDSLRVSSRKRSKGCVLNKGSEENGDANRFRGARGASLVSAGLCGQLLNRDLGYARMGPRAARRHAFARAIAAGLFSRILWARAFASDRRRSAGTTRFTRPIRSAVAASIRSPV